MRIIMSWRRSRYLRNEKKRFERLLGSAALGFTATDFLSPAVLFAYGT